LLTNFLITVKGSHGQTLTEMAFILALVFLVVVVVIPLFGTQVTQLYTDVMAGFGG
jgi:Flp pilus assembly pilin Flp